MTAAVSQHPNAIGSPGLSAGDRAERDLRYARVREGMAAGGLDLVLAFAPGWRRENFCYLTDARIAGSYGLIAIPVSGELSAFSTRTSDLNTTRSTGWITDVDLIGLSGSAALTDRISDSAPKRIGIAHLELMPAALLDAIKKAAPGAEVISATKLLDSSRMVKSEWELTRMRKAATVCAAGWQKFVDVLEPGLPEFKIVAEVESELKRLGATDNFMLIASGGDEVLGMTPPGDRLLAAGDMVRTELTPQVSNYWLQICRSAVVGEPTDGQRRSHDLFKEAYEAGKAAVHPGVTAHEVAVAENDVFRKYGYGEYCTSQWTRVRGHGHGLHFDETPIVEDNHTVLPEGSVFIIHPNTYTPLAGYHVFGDPVVNTATGAEVLIATEGKLFFNPIGASA